MRDEEGSTEIRSISIFIWVLSFLNRYRIRVAGLIICGLVISGVQLIIPKVIAYLIDVAIPRGQMSVYYTTLAVIAPVIVLMFLIIMRRNKLEREISESAAKDLQISLFNKLRSLGVSYMERHSTGEILSMMNTDVGAVQQIFHRFFPNLIRESLIAVVALLILFSHNAKITVLSLLFLLLYYLIGPFLKKKSVAAAKEAAANLKKLNVKIYETLSSILEIRALGREGWEQQRLGEKQGQYYKSKVSSVRYVYLHGASRWVFIYLGMIILFIEGSNLVQLGNMSIGSFVSYTMYYFLFMGSLTVIIDNLTEQALIMVQAERLYKFNQNVPDLAEELDAVTLSKVEGSIQLKSVTYGYLAGREIINNLHLNIMAGEHVAIVGPSGSGKSTLLKLIDRFYDPVSGEILLDGTPLKNIPLTQLRDSTGFVFQETYLFGSTIMENIKFGNPQASDDDVYKAAQIARADEFISNLPEGYGTIIRERGVNLSGGQRQRIALARMIIKDPAILLLDEATSALDNITENEVLSEITRLFRGRTIIAVSHRLSNLSMFDRIIFVDQGSVQEEGSFDELLERKGNFYTLYEGNA